MASATEHKPSATTRNARTTPRMAVSGIEFSRHRFDDPFFWPFLFFIKKISVVVKKNIGIYIVDSVKSV